MTAAGGIHQQAGFRKHAEPVRLPKLPEEDRKNGLQYAVPLRAPIALQYNAVYEIPIGFVGAVQVFFH